VFKDLDRARNEKDVLMIEENLTSRYLTAIGEVLSEKLNLHGTEIGTANTSEGSPDPIVSLFNYGYSVLESVCLRAVNGANLDPHIGFLHRRKLTRSPLVDDFKGPYQWLVDKTIIQAVENDHFKKHDFVRNEDSTIGLRPDALKGLIGELDRTFSQLIKYKGRNHQWYVLIQIKAQELSHYLTNNLKNLDLSSPEPYLEKLDSKELRQKILGISYSDWYKKGYSHGSLHYLKECAKSTKPLKLNKQSAERIDSMD
jgi:CRISPR-associated protein Cas1